MLTKPAQGRRDSHDGLPADLVDQIDQIDQIDHWITTRGLGPVATGGGFSAGGGTS